MKLSLLNGSYSIIQLPKNDNMPQWIDFNDDFISITKTQDELSIICKSSHIPVDLSLKHDPQWIIFKIDEILSLSSVGILYSISKILKENNIGIFVMSTYNTDYFLIKEYDKDDALKCLALYYEILS